MQRGVPACIAHVSMSVKLSDVSMAVKLKREWNHGTMMVNSAQGVQVAVHIPIPVSMVYFLIMD